MTDTDCFGSDMGGNWLHFSITAAQLLQMASEGNSAEDFVADNDFHIKRLKQRHDRTIWVAV